MMSSHICDDITIIQHHIRTKCMHGSSVSHEMGGMNACYQFARNRMYTFIRNAFIYKYS
ncbi:hypothetical protein HanIR_Chr09g0404181 [Helianthus annuus]|nr:hypothetical protein HanIR_Chr09g0404181 [Helianthus annuus]